MMTRQEAFDHEEDVITDEYNRGEITEKEFKKAIREMHRDHRRQIEEAAQDAYDEEWRR